jgi:uncharacterized protein
MVLTGQTLLAGDARGPVVALAPLSFWGGFDPETGLVTDRSHSFFGGSLTGVVLVMSASRGSSSSASVLAEAIRLGTAPAAIVLAEPDAILLAGAVVAAELYGRTCPVALLSPDDHARLATAGFAAVETGSEGAVVRIEPALA